MRIDNAMLWTEQRAEAKRRLIYSVALWMVCIAAAVAGVICFGIAAWDDGFDKGQKAERAKVQLAPKPASEICTKEQARICANQEIERFRNFGRRKPT